MFLSEPGVLPERWRSRWAAGEPDRLARERQAHLPAKPAGQLSLTRANLDAHRTEAERLLRSMVGVQEELDCCCYCITPEKRSVGRNAAGGSATSAESVDRAPRSVEPVPGSTLRVPVICFLGILDSFLSRPKNSTKL